MKYITFICLTVLIISCNNEIENPKKEFPIHLNETTIEFDFDNGSFYLQGEKQDLNNYSKQIEEILKSEIGSMKYLYEFDSVTYINDSIIDFYRYYDVTLTAKYEVNNGQITINQIKDNQYFDYWENTENGKDWDYIDLNYEKIVLERTVTKIKGTLYDENGQMVDANGDGIINENDLVSVTTYLKGSQNIDQIIKDQFNEYGAGWEINKADSIVVIPYKLILK